MVPRFSSLRMNTTNGSGEEDASKSKSSSFDELLANLTCSP